MCHCEYALFDLYSGLSGICVAFEALLPKCFFQQDHSKQRACAINLP